MKRRNWIALIVIFILFWSGFFIGVMSWNSHVTKLSEKKPKEEARAAMPRVQIEHDSVSNVCHNGLALHGDKICRALYYFRYYYYDTMYYRTKNSMPQDFDEALVYGPYWTPLRELKAWCLDHGQTTFARLVESYNARCIYYRYVRKGESFRIYQPLDHDTMRWKSHNGPTEGWVKIWANDAYWEKGQLHVRDDLSVGFAYNVAPDYDK